MTETNGMTGPLANLLIIDDEAALMRALCDTLQSEGYRTTGFTSASEALKAPVIDAST